MSRYEDLAERLEAIVAELDELSFDLLQQAVADGATQRPAADRSLTQARRAVEKAAVLLRQSSDRPASIGQRRHEVVGGGCSGGGSATR